MAAIEEPEVQFAQRLACNEKSIRTKALKKLRKYISVRSHSPAGGFTDVELLKLWKGLFYCLWMQDKPLMQEELSRNIATLIHSFHQIDTKLLYFVSFLQTVKREWTGIDRLRMDKFFQLVRFMFRQTFETLKRNGWDGGEIGRFAEVLKAELLQGGSGAPSGLQLHVLDLYMTELAAVGSAELTAEQNLTFIEPFCKTAAKTKDRTLFSAICSGVFGVIIDQAPFAIQDLMKELEAVDSDSGQASEEEEEEKLAGKKKKLKVSKSKEEDEDEDEDEMLDPEDPDSEMQDDIGPVLQFDYSAVADKLLELSSRSGTPGPNRQRLYRIIKVLRDLSEGIFPQEEYPEEVSTDEDDDMFATRKKLKRMKRRGLIDADLDDSPAAKKMKKKKTVDKPNEDGAPADVEVGQGKKKKKKKKKRKKAEVNNNEMENGCGGLECLVKESPEAVRTSVPEETLPAEPTDQSQEEEVVDDADVSSDKSSPAAKKRRKKKKKKAASALTGKEESACETTAAPQAETGNDGEKTDAEASALSSQAAGTILASPETHIKTPAKKKKKNLKEAETKQTDSEASGQKAVPLQNSDATPALKKEEEEGLRAELQLQGDVQVNGVSPEKRSTPQHIAAKKKSKRRSLKLSQTGGAADQHTSAPEETPAEAESSGPPQKKKKQVAVATALQDAGQEPQEVKILGKAAKKKKKIPVVFEFEADELEKTSQSEDPPEQQTPPSILKKKKKKVSGASKPDFISFQSRAAVPTPLFCRTRGNPDSLRGRKKLVRTGKSQPPDSGSKKVTFGLKNNKTAEFKKTDRSLLLSPDGSSRVPFDPTQKPKCGVLKSPVTRLAAAKSKRGGLGNPNSTPKPQRRPAAADFF